jgi:hypothetical protein
MLELYNSMLYYSNITVKGGGLIYSNHSINIKVVLWIIRAQHINLAAEATLAVEMVGSKRIWKRLLACQRNKNHFKSLTNLKIGADKIKLLCPGLIKPFLLRQAKKGFLFYFLLNFILDDVNIFVIINICCNLFLNFLAQ